jgi:hypothetical protein
MSDELESFCIQRRKKQLMFNPLTRFEKQSPYGGRFTKEDFDMRRKVEILEYKKDDFKVKQDTQKDVFSKVIKGNNNKQLYQKSFYNLGQSTLYLDVYDKYVYSEINYIICNNTSGPNYKTPSSSAGVPGNLELYKDESVPLYNYKNDRNYGAQPPLFDYNLYVQSTQNLKILPQVETEILNFYTIKASSNETNVTKLSIPISLFVNGEYLQVSENQQVDIKNITYALNTKNYKSKFNDNIKQQGSYIDTSNFTDNIDFDISFNPTPTNKKFNIEFYMGNIEITGLTYNSATDYVYDLLSTFQTTVPDNAANTLIGLQSNNRIDLSFGLTINPTKNVDISNCILNSTQNKDSVIPLIINATSNNNNEKVEIKYTNQLFENKILYPVVSNTPTIVTINKNLSSHVWFDVVTYNNQKKIFLRNSVYRNGTYYVEDISFNENTKYYMRKGKYYFVNISQNHPIALLNKSVASDITYDNNTYSRNPQYSFNTVSVTTSDGVTSSEADPSYNFYWNSIEILVKEDFNSCSLYCKNHGYMGGKDILNYGTGDFNEPPQIIPIIEPPLATINVDGVNVVNPESAKQNLQTQYNTFSFTNSNY